MVVEQTEAPESVAAVASASVEIAQIEAERAIAVATIEAETTAAVIEAQAEDEDVAWLREELDGLRGRCETSEAALSDTQRQCQEMAVQLASLTETVATQAAAILLLTPPPPSEAEAAEAEAEAEAAAPAPPAEAEDNRALRRKRWM